VPCCCSDGGSVDHSPSSPTEVDDLLEFSLDTSDSEDDDWWNNQHVIECTSKVKARTVTSTGCPRSRLYTWLIYLFNNTCILWMQCIRLCNIMIGTQTDASPHHLCHLSWHI